MKKRGVKMDKTSMGLWTVFIVLSVIAAFMIAGLGNAALTLFAAIAGARFGKLAAGGVE